VVVLLGLVEHRLVFSLCAAGVAGLVRRRV
jgi:hypothetical protein